MAITKIQSESLNLADDYSFTGTITGAGGDNKPAFYAVHSTGQSIPSATNTKITYDSEVFDTDNCYDNSTNYRFTPTSAGKYYVCAWMHLNSAVIKTVQIFKNGSSVTDHRLDNSSAAEATVRCIAIVDMNGSTDYIEIYGRQNEGTTKNIEGNTTNQRTGFFAYKIIT